MAAMSQASPDAGGSAPSDAPAAEKERARRKPALFGAGAVVAVALAVAFVAWLAIDRGDETSTPQAESTIPSGTAPATTSPVATPRIATIADLRALKNTAFYWAGNRVGTRFELTSAADGTVFIRYLAPGQQAGSQAPALTVATYSRPDGFAEVERAAKRANVTRLDLPEGGLAVVDERGKRNVHLAYPGQPYQVEVYSPQPGLARRLVESGAIVRFS
jgi:hypothetical protein